MLIIKENFSPLAEFGHRIQQGIMTLICIADSNIIPVGTGFTIAADGLMMTATHVVEEAMKHATKTSVEGKSELQLPEFYALYLTAETHGENNEFTLGGLLPIQRVWYSEGLDIALCWLTSPTVNDQPLKYPIFRPQIEVAVSTNTQPQIFSVYELIQKGFVATNETITSVKAGFNEKGERIVFYSS